MSLLEANNDKLLQTLALTHAHTHAHTNEYTHTHMHKHTHTNAVSFVAPPHTNAYTHIQVLSALWLLHILLVRCKLLTPKVSLAAGAWTPEVMSCLLLNSVVLGVVCRYVV